MRWGLAVCLDELGRSEESWQELGLVFCRSSPVVGMRLDQLTTLVDSLLIVAARTGRLDDMVRFSNVDRLIGLLDLVFTTLRDRGGPERVLAEVDRQRRSGMGDLLQLLEFEHEACVSLGRLEDARRTARRALELVGDDRSGDDGAAARWRSRVGG